MNTPTTILKKVFGYNEFRPLQEEIIENILRKKDSLVIMPTGGGKSLCYQIPALLFEGLTIVVSPLISLMKDQVEQLREFGVDAVLLNSAISSEEYSYNISQILNGNARLLYVAPETLLKQNILEMLSSVKVECLAIDEAHCISEWGHDFRPEYRQLVDVRSMFPGSACIALTATATPRVCEDIKKSLNFDESSEFVGSFDRENLMIDVVQKENPLDQILNVLEKWRDQSGIIYCFSRRQVDELSDILGSEGFSVRPYHAGMSDEERHRNQELFIRDDVQIIVATIAFGMGINKPNVRFVIHNDLPKNIESYYQEIGRAGRDGLNSSCMLLFSYGDIQKIKYFINEKEEREKALANIHLNALVRYAETEDCRRIVLLNYFGEEYKKDNCGMCDNCLSEQEEKIDITIYAQKFLSCVKRTNEIFGAGHIIDVLRGSSAQKVLKFGHQDLSTYGIGKELSKKQWIHLSRQFIHQGLLEQDMEYGSLKLTEKAWDVLKGILVFKGRLDEEDKGETIEKDRGTDVAIDYDKELYDILRNQRKEMADKSNLPPYIIFPDKTLLEMSSFFPQSMENLLNIHGVGEAKLEKYGQLFLDTILKYCRENDIEEKRKGGGPKRQAAVKSVGKKRFQVIGELYNEGRSISEIMRNFSIKQGTVLDNLYRYLQEGNTLESDDIINYTDLDPGLHERVVEAFQKHGEGFLRPVFDEFKGSISYEELKIIRLYYIYKNSNSIAVSSESS